MLSTRSEHAKLDRLAGHAFRNALRLHFDSILLFRNHSYASAFGLSVLALEEFAKSHLLEDQYFHATIDGTEMDSKLRKEFSQMLVSHHVKQRVFSSMVFFPWQTGSDGEFKMDPFSRRAFKGALERSKQDSFYVGLKIKAGRQFPEGRISSPLQMTAIPPRRNITIVNDYVLEIVAGVVTEYSMVDAPSIERQINQTLLSQLLDQWPLRSRRTKRYLKIYRS